MSRLYICGLVVAVVLCTASEAAPPTTPPPPVGTYACGNGTVKFTVDPKHTNYTYATVSVQGATDMTKCSTNNKTGDIFTLTVTPGECNVTKNSTGYVSLQFLIAQSEYVTQDGDVLNDVACNVSGSGERSVKAVISNKISVDGSIGSKTATSPIPKTNLVAKDVDEKSAITNVKLGAKFKLCVELESTPSPYKGFSVGKCTFEGIEVTNEKGCKKAVDGVMTLSSSPEGFSHKEKDTSSCIVLPAFRGKGKVKSDNVSITCDVTYYLEQKEQKADTCPKAKRLRREAPLTDGVTREVRLVLNIEDPRERNSASDGCPGHISSTVFYVVVSILAGLLVVTIAVAIFLARRGRMSHDFNSGKDNGAFEMVS